MKFEGAVILALLAAALGSPCLGKEDGGLLFRFGAIADCQYCDAEGTHRQYRLSPQKLEECVSDLNTQELSHVVHLGDFIDRDWKSFDVVIPIMDKSKARVYHVLGNHDFSVEDKYKNKVPRRLGLRKRFYDFKIGSWRFLILDTNDLSLYAHPEGSRRANKSEEAYEALGGKLPKYNGGIGSAQLKWIEKKLKAAEARGETVVLHSHHPVYPITSHAAWNAEEVVEVLEKYSCVAAYINGHNHKGAYEKRNGIHYLTLKGMVDTEETAYSVISVFEDRLVIKGVGRQEDFELRLRDGL